MNFNSVSKFTRGNTVTAHPRKGFVSVPKLIK